MTLSTNTSASGAGAQSQLAAELDARRDALRAPSLVMAPEMLGAVRLTRYSFNRMMLRRASTEGWTVRRTRFAIDALGAGEAAYEINLGEAEDGQPRSATFVAFTRLLDESEHTDRVIANRWEITACLVDGPLTDELADTLRTQIPQQEQARLDPRVLVLTRGNRSVRFFQYLVDRLAEGNQPDCDHVGDSGYIMRSTAFYANGKYGMRSFEGYPPGHPLGVPYRAQFVCAWLFRELSYDIVEHCAAEKAAVDGTTAAGFDEKWRRYFGLGNATGLGLVPYAFKHPRIVNSWIAVREIALAEVRAMAPTEGRSDVIDSWIGRASAHLATGTGDDCTPFRSPQELRPALDAITEAWAAVRESASATPFDDLYRWAEATGDPETTEWVVSLLLELSELDDDDVDGWLLVDDEEPTLPPSTSVGDIRQLIEAHWSWIDDLDVSSAEADAFWWVISDNTEEPRRAPRERLGPEGRDVAIDVALRIARLRDAVTADTGDPDRPIGDLLDEQPEHRLAVRRLATASDPYGEPRDNVCSANYLPLQMQRFQLAQYGMDHFKPKSTDWLRVTLNQGAPRVADLNACSASPDGPSLDDAWPLPPRPDTQ